LDDTGEIDGEEGPGETWSVGAIDVGAESKSGVVRSVVDASSTSFKREDKKLGSPEASPLTRAFAFVLRFTPALAFGLTLETFELVPLPLALALAALEDSPFC
jgi:hypothetical protein